MVHIILNWVKYKDNQSYKETTPIIIALLKKKQILAKKLINDCTCNVKLENCAYCAKS